MKNILLFSIFFYFGMSPVTAQKDKINWQTWSELEASLKKEPKPVFLFFEADWCAYCKKIKREVFTKKEIIAKLNSAYYSVKMNVESRDTIYFDGMTFTNEQSKTQRSGVHQLPLLLASREGKAFSLPATLLLDKSFNVQQRVFEYYTSSRLLELLQ